jgi:hypothetical protein
MEANAMRYATIRPSVLAAAAIAVCGMLATSTLLAQPPERGRYGRYDHYDGRFNHNHVYPGRGYFIGALPRERFEVVRGPNRFFYSGGVWYAPRGAGFVVVGAPIGVFVPVLPPFYTTVWVAGAPYYYADDTYYTYRGPQGYEVVDPPDEQAATTQAPVSDNIFIYPKNGQSAEQQASDKYDCHRWATSQAGFDPTQPGGGGDPQQTGPKRADYQRAMAACLEGRGYTVK